MAIDAALLEAAAREETPPTLRFYGWSPPAVSLGRFQPVHGLDLDYARRRGWDVVRRPTGGRGVLHQHELTYSVTLPPSALRGMGVRSSYRVLTSVLNLGLRSLLGGAAEPFSPPEGCALRVRGLANCFSVASECDTVASGGKLAGSAQVRRDGALLQHGAILLDAEPEAWTGVFGAPGELLTLRRLLGRPVAADEVADAIVAAFERGGARVKEGALTGEELHAAGSLRPQFAVPPTPPM